MIYFTDYELDRLLEDDAPVGDMTTELLGIDHEPCSLLMTARQLMVVSGVEEVVRLYQKVGVEVVEAVDSGTRCCQGQLILRAKGDAGAVHAVWRTGGVLLAYASGVAGRTALLVEKATAENPSVSVAGTRKHPPYLKKVVLKAVIAGGGVFHRGGLSDTILFFREHLIFRGGYNGLEDIVSAVRQKQKERKIVVEAHTAEEVMLCVRSGADAVQIDKMPVPVFADCVRKSKLENPSVTILAAGGVDGENAAAYARAGADVLVTSWMYYAPPADVQVEISPLNC